MGILINIISPDKNIQRYIELTWTVAHLKERLELITGIPISAQHLRLSTNTTITDSTATLDTFEIQPNSCLYVSDIRDQTKTDQSDLEEIEHFKLSDEAYTARSNTFLKWRETHSSTLTKTDLDQKKICERGIQINQQCYVEGGDETREGRVRFIGQVEGLPEGLWVGVEYNAPVGKNDGSFQGIHYFTTKQGHGSFVRPNRIRMISPQSTDTDSDKEL